ncbi:Caveolin-1 [Mactra antiquata]
MADSLDMVNRDPNNLNDHLKVQFEDVFGEPEGARSIDCVWKLSYTCFTCWLGLCYKIATLLYGICIAAEWGCEFASIAFYHIWYVTPMLRVCEINCEVFKKLTKTCCNCCMEPCCEACGALFIHFKK